LEGSKFKGSKDKIVINWGNSMPNQNFKDAVVINDPSAVKKATNKLTLFNLLSQHEVNIPEFTTKKDEALKWSQEGVVVVVREKLTGNSAEGLVILGNQIEFEDYNHKNAKMYVKYIPKKDEFRVHVFNGEVFDVQRKALRADYPKHLVNWKVRNHDNGFIFARQGFKTPNGVLQEALKAVLLTGLDFGAVDIVWNNYRQKAYVLEINTAPGLEGTTLEKYSEALSEIGQPKFEKKVFQNEDKMIKFISQAIIAEEKVQQAFVDYDDEF
jgi:glutathione synthase/RimK-type ligase-like ATP-grasp enzyme